jgi:hypothetical protein
MLFDAFSKGEGSMADVGAEEPAIWVGLSGLHVVVTMAGERAVQLAGSLARSDIADSAEIGELAQLLSRATAERDKLAKFAPRRFFGSFQHRRWSATPQSLASETARRGLQPVDHDEPLTDLTFHQTPTPASSHQPLETINAFVVDAWSSASGHGERSPDLPAIHISASEARTAAILGPRSVDTLEPTDGIHDVSAEFTAYEAADRLEAAIHVADVVATAASQAALVATASQFALKTATQAREAATEASRAAATAAAASIKFEHLVQDAAVAARAEAQPRLLPSPMQVPLTLV